MAEVKNSFIGSKMNKDLDERLIPSNEYRDAVNIAVSRSAGSDVGALEAIEGNAPVSDTSVGSGYQTIGVFADESSGCIYNFATQNTSEYNATNGHSITQYNTVTGIKTTLVFGYFLNFSTKDKIKAVNLVENLLFWTDGRNQPRKINIDNALSEESYYTNEAQISVCKFSPYEAPALVNKRSISTLDPSTMTKAVSLTTVRISQRNWSISNLGVTKYANGDEIPQVQDPTAWAALTTGAWCYYNNDPSDSSSVGKLYNKYAVADSRGLAPKGWRVATAADYDTLFSTAGGGNTGVNATNTKAKLKTTGWATDTDNENTLGFSAIPTGYRNNAGAFNYKIGSSASWSADQKAYWWTSESTNERIAMANSQVNSDSMQTAPETAGVDSKDGYAVRIIKSDTTEDWPGDPEFLKEKFVRFSYRFKFDDGEYSTIAPFTQDAFVPQQSGLFGTEDEEEAFRSSVIDFMQNDVDNIGLNIPLPSKDILKDYKIKEVDIIYKESDALAYKVLQTIPVDNSFKNNLNNTNILQYSYESTLPYVTLPEDETTRIFDKVPVKANTQESSGGRIIYGNITEGYTAPKSINYGVSYSEKSNQDNIEYPNHSIKQNRNYTVGFVLADKYGRQTDTILSSNDGKVDTDGTPIPSSNIFIPYSSARGSVSGWKGDNMDINVNDIIPDSLPNLQGYPGLYADPVTWTTTFSQTNAFWKDLSTQTLTSETTSTTWVFSSFTFYTWDNTSSDNKNLYKNTGDGWVVVDPSTYTAAAGAGSALSFTGLSHTGNEHYKVEIKFALAGGKTGYKYQIKDLYSGWGDGSATYFHLDRAHLRGLYTDYTLIQSRSHSSNILTFYTEDEINPRYLFANLAALGITGSADIHKDSAYIIQENGFYSYRVVVKQPEQEYYNVYLPGIVNGYPIKGNNSEQGDTAFITLVGDNINKIPRTLNNTSDTDVKFNSDVKLYGRVENITSTANKQFNTSTVGDEVTLIGSTKDIFKADDGTDLHFGTSTGELVSTSIYGHESQPLVAKISTAKPIGVTEDQFTAPKLAVYETEPFVSLLDIFYETTTTGLISDLNYNVLNSTTGIIDGLSVSDSQLSINESNGSGTQVTPDFFPQSGGVNVNNTTAELISVYSKNPDETLNTSVNRSSEFALAAGSSTGSYKISSATDFYAGADVDTAEFYQFNIEFKTSNGNYYAKSLSTTLGNVAPTIADSGSLPASLNANSTVILTNTTRLLKGRNGSDDGSKAAQGLTWSIESVTKDGVDVTSDNLFTVYQSTVGVVGSEAAYVYPTVTCSLNTLGASQAWVIKLKVTDALNLHAYKDITFTSSSIRYDKVVWATYNPVPNAQWANYSTSQVDANNTSSSVSTWKGEIQNWTNTQKHLWYKLESYGGYGNLAVDFKAQWAGVAVTGTAFDIDRTNSNMYIASPGAVYFYIGVLAAFNPTDAQVAANVKPGQYSNGNYDFRQCALVNVTSTTNISGSGVADLIWSDSITNGLPTGNQESLALRGLVNPIVTPFYYTGQVDNRATVVNYPTTPPVP